MKFTIFASTTLLCVSAALTGCASGYKEFYRAANGMTAQHITESRIAPPQNQPLVERARPGNPDEILAAYAKRGYVMIGNSSFNSGRSEPEENAIRQAQEVGADLVLILNPSYTGTVTSSVPIVTPTTSTTYSNATATAYGRGGPVTAYGSGTSTTYGTTTNYIPISISRSDFGAVYFIKQKFGLGAYFRDLNDAERNELQTNKGAVMRLVVDGTPAFDSDILVGDVLVSIDGTAIASQMSLGELLRARSGRSVVISLLRRGQSLQKTVQLNRL